MKSPAPPVVSAFALITNWGSMGTADRGRGRRDSRLIHVVQSISCSHRCPKTETIRAKAETTETRNEGEDILEDISDGFKVLKAVPVDFFLPG